MKSIQNIRLQDKHLNAIIESFHAHFLNVDHLWIFGSRTDPNKKGGDIDLYIETNALSIDDAFNMKIKFLLDIKKKIGDQKIDVVLNLLNVVYDLSIYKVAKEEGIQLA